LAIGPDWLRCVGRVNNFFGHSVRISSFDSNI
jgi:hypothetical protein